MVKKLILWLFLIIPLLGNAAGLQMTLHTLQEMGRPVVGAADPGEFLTNGSSGFVAYSWYVASDYYTNSGVPTWPNRTAAGSLLNLTNSAGTATRYPSRVAAAINGQATVDFSGEGDGTGDWMRNMAYSGGTKHEVVMVLNAYPGAQPGSTTTPLIVDDGGVEASRHYIAYGGPAYIAYSTDYQGAITYTMPTSYHIMDGVWGYGSSGLYTNNALFMNGGAAAGPMTGITLGTRRGLESNRHAKMSIAEIITYKDTLPGTNTTARTAIYDYLKTKYGL